MDNRGSTLIENVISIFLLALFALMASFCLLAGMNAIKDASLEHQRLYRVYTQIESNDYGSEIQSEEKDLTFTFQGQDDEGNSTDESYTIEGTIYYEEKKILGEFIRKPSAP